MSLLLDSPLRAGSHWIVPHGLWARETQTAEGPLYEPRAPTPPSVHPETPSTPRLWQRGSPRTWGSGGAAP